MDYEIGSWFGEPKQIERYQPTTETNEGGWFHPSDEEKGLLQMICSATRIDFNGICPGSDNRGLVIKGKDLIVQPAA